MFEKLGSVKMVQVAGVEQAEVYNLKSIRFNLEIDSSSGYAPVSDILYRLMYWYWTYWYWFCSPASHLFSLETQIQLSGHLIFDPCSRSIYLYSLLVKRYKETLNIQVRLTQVQEQSSVLIKKYKKKLTVSTNNVHAWFCLIMLLLCVQFCVFLSFFIFFSSLAVWMKKYDEAEWMKQFVWCEVQWIVGYKCFAEFYTYKKILIISKTAA